MTTRIAILPYGPSDSCTALRDSLTSRFTDHSSINVRLLRSGNNSVFRGRRSDIIINYGNRSAPAEVFGEAHVLNPQSALNNAANKLSALNAMQRAGVSTLPFTTDSQQARIWAAGGDVVYARNTLNGHSGEGIVVVSSDNISQIGNAPLYTKGITGRRREWRVHVFDGIITHVQVKRRRNGYQEDPNYREDVRNHHTGWIYATENINPSQAVLRNAVRAVEAMGLDFGAVDIISKGDEAWVLEVNTAAGLQAETTMTAFTDALFTYIHNRVNNLTDSTRLQYNAVFVVEPEEQEVEEAADEMFALDTEAGVPQEEPARPSRVRGVPSPQPLDLRQSNNSFMSAPAREDGYYLADILQADGRAWSSDVIVWVANGFAYRHGWNLPIANQGIRNFRLISSAVDNNGNSVAF